MRCWLEAILLLCSLPAIIAGRRWPGAVAWGMFGFATVMAILAVYPGDPQSRAPLSVISLALAAVVLLFHWRSSWKDE
jgi:hypothetical protein